MLGNFERGERVEDVKVAFPRPINGSKLRARMEKSVKEHGCDIFSLHP